VDAQVARHPVYLVANRFEQAGGICILNNKPGDIFEDSQPLADTVDVSVNCT
jgi:hypothetical protein